MSLAPLAATLWWLHRLRRTGLPWPEMQQRARLLAAGHGVRRPVEILLYEETRTPLMCGLWRPSIVLPADARDWNEVGLRCAVVHELEHVRRGDWIVQLTARVVSACYWFHPLVWIAWRQLCLEAERACDDSVIESEERTDYDTAPWPRRTAGCREHRDRRRRDVTAQFSASEAAGAFGVHHALCLARRSGARVSTPTRAWWVATSASTGRCIRW